jgi:uncharacterized membrane protein YqjE
VTATPEPGATSIARHAAEPSLGDLVAEASSSFSTILHGEIELAKLEVRSSLKNAGVGAGFFAAAAVLLVFALVFGFIALAEGLVAIGLWRWLAYLAVFVLLLVVIALFVLMGIRKMKRVKAPQQTIDTSRDTVAYLKANSTGNTTAASKAASPVP